MLKLRGENDCAILLGKAITTWLCSPPRQSTLARRVASAADEDPHPKPAARTRTETANAILTDRDESTPVGRTLSQ